MVKFKAYCWNPETGRDFTKVIPNVNLVQRANLNAIETIEFLPNLIYLSDGSKGTDGRWTRKACELNWNRPYSWGSVVWKPEGEEKKTGITFCTDYDKGNYPNLYPKFKKPNLTQGQVYTYSAEIYNPSDKPINVVLRAIWGQYDQTIQTVSIGAEKWQKMATTFTLPYTGTTERFGITVETEEATTEATTLEIYFPKIEQGSNLTPFSTDGDEIDRDRKLDECDSIPPFTGFYEGSSASDNYKDYTWTGSKGAENFFYLEERGICKQEAVWCYSRPLGQRVLIGIDSDTYDVESGRTIKFHVLNGNKGIFDLTGSVIYPEQFTDKRQTFDIDTRAWVDNQEPLYVTDANTAIDCTFGEMASNIIQGYYYQQADKRYRVDELVRSAMINVGYNMGSYWSKWGFDRYMNEMRASYEIENCRISEKTEYSNMNDWTSNVCFPTGAVIQPYKPKLTESDTQALKGTSTMKTIWLPSVLKTERDVEDWFRTYSNSRTRPVPTELLFANFTTKKAWLFTDKGNGTWSKSSEFTIPGGATAYATAWSAIIPQNGELKGNVIMTDKNYADFPNNARPVTLGVEELFPTIQYENVKFNPQMYTMAYNTKLSWWGQKANVANLTYGECGIRATDFMTGLCTIERVYK